jgi:enoyl-CoA hydratase/carnithine racemase
VIGAKGANFLTWSCLHHLSLHYGPLYRPENQLEIRKESGQNWYPLNHFRPLVNWTLDPETEAELNTIVMGALYQMTSLMVHEHRAQPAVMNLIGEVCAQFTRGILAHCRQAGPHGVRQQVAQFHKLLPEAALSPWYPQVFDQMDSPEWQQLYVNAEHNGQVGTITIARESYNRDVDAELNRAIDWLNKQGIKSVIVTGDFHLSTQMVGADTNEFFPAIVQAEEGIRIAATWSATARRLHTEFDVSVGFIHGKRCMGGMLELLMHCHYLIAPSSVSFAMPEVTLPVLPGMEGCHWALRKCPESLRINVLHMLLTGKAVKASETVGWLLDVSGTMDQCLLKAWEIANKGAKAQAPRPFVETGFAMNSLEWAALEPTTDPALQGAREAIAACIDGACAVGLEQALPLQAKYSGEFMTTQLCRRGRVGSERDKIVNV